MAVTNDRVADERLRRIALWGKLYADGGAEALHPSRLRELRVYGGARGFWVDKERTTGQLTNDGVGVTVAVLHTGRYNDDLSDNEVVYSYPRTLTPGWDANQITATRNAMRLRIPVFVVAPSPVKSGMKKVRLGWVVELDDLAGQVLITLGEEPMATLLHPGEADPFAVLEPKSQRTAVVRQRSGQGRFRYLVMARYGPSCAMCQMDVMEVLETPHIVPYAARGTNDPRNGMVMCATHHRAFDAHLFAIEPGTLAIHLAPTAPSPERLRVTVDRLEGEHALPHPDAIAWRWNMWRKTLRV
jgi:hypothetical protein